MSNKDENRKGPFRAKSLLLVLLSAIGGGVLVLAVLAGLWSMSSKSYTESYYDGVKGVGASNMNSVSFGGGPVYDDVSYDMDYAVDAPESSGSDTSVYQAGRKFIRTASMSIETLDYDSYVKNLDNTLLSLGAYMESTSCDTYGGSGYRRYSATIRVPDEKLEQLLAMLPEGGSVLNSSTSVDDVTLRYTDTEAHRDMLLEERSWLMTAMAGSDDLEQLLMVRDRLTDVNYEIESMERQLRTMDNQIEYATVRFTLTEVRRLEEEPTGFLERIMAGIKENFEDVTEFLVDATVWTVSHVFSFLLLAAVIFIIVMVFRIRKKRRAKTAAMSGSNTI